jgi:hypothetical protein
MSLSGIQGQVILEGTERESFSGFPGRRREARLWERERWNVKAGRERTKPQHVCVLFLLEGTVRATGDRCYDFLNIFAEKFIEKIGVFDSK